MDTFFSDKDPGYYSTIKPLLPDICGYLECSAEEVRGIYGVTRMGCDFYHLGRVVKQMPHTNSIILGSKNTFCLNAINYCVSKSKKIKYIMISFGVLDKPAIIITKVGCVFSLAREANTLYKSKSPLIDKPILEHDLLSNVINDTIYFVKNTRMLKQYNIPLTRGLVFTGPPGNGKTLLCNYLKSLVNGKKHHYNNLSSSGLAESLKKSKNPFDYTYTFVDDVDINLFDRSKSDLACSLLTMMDGYTEIKKPRVIIFTTNEPTSSLDKAFFRPGRIDKEYKFEKPTQELREKFINTWHIEIKQAINISKLVIDTEEYSFAELNLIKTYLVTNFYNTKRWDIDYALRLVNEDFHQNKNKILGF